MIRLAERFCSVENTEKDYLAGYVNSRIRNVFMVVLDHIHDTIDTESAFPLFWALYVADEEKHIRLRKDAAKAIAEYEQLYRNDCEENSLIPASIPTTERALEEWVASPLNELVEILNDDENETTPSLEGEYLLFHIIRLAVGLYIEVEEEQEERGVISDKIEVVTARPTKEIVEMAIRYAFSAKEENYFSPDDPDDDIAENTDENDLFITFVQEAIDAMTDIRCYVGDKDNPHELLTWDWDYMLLDEMAEIPEPIKKYLGI